MNINNSDSVLKAMLFNPFAKLIKAIWGGIIIILNTFAIRSDTVYPSICQTEEEQFEDCFPSPYPPTEVLGTPPKQQKGRKTQPGLGRQLLETITSEREGIIAVQNHVRQLQESILHLQQGPNENIGELFKALLSMNYRISQMLENMPEKNLKEEREQRKQFELLLYTGEHLVEDFMAQA